jgi:hypothetical protein
VSSSFTPDMVELDEEGIRNNIRHNISKGMFSFLCQTEVCAMTFGECKRFVEIACDEAKGKILASMFKDINTIEQDIELLKHFKKVGGTHTFLGWSGMFYVELEEWPVIVAKYMQWFAGGNSGMYRQLTGMIFQQQKDTMRAGLKAAGITRREPEEEFFVGQINYSKDTRFQY